MMVCVATGFSDTERSRDPMSSGDHTGSGETTNSSDAMGLALTAAGGPGRLPASWNSSGRGLRSTGAWPEIGLRTSRADRPSIGPAGSYTTGISLGLPILEGM